MSANPVSRPGDRSAFRESPPPTAGDGPIRARGVPAADGLASGRAHKMSPAVESTEEDRPLAPGEEKSEARRLRAAIRRSLDEIQALRECMLSDPDDPGLKILDVQRMLLDDQDFQKKVLDQIRLKQKTAASALAAVFRETVAPLESAGSEYFRARAADLLDVKRRILKHLEGSEATVRPIPRGSIVVASEISPSETTSFDPEMVCGVITDHGGPTSHAAILARSRGIPAVVGLGNVAGHVREGDLILVDGYRGTVIARPGPSELKDFEKLRRREARRTRRMAERDAGPAVTVDGHPITLLANMESEEDAAKILEAGAQGVGLFRTEFFYLKGRNLPDEEEQYRVYRKIAHRFRPSPVTIRTLDAGGDKFASFLGTRKENNPFLGLRGIRFSLSHPEIFRTQVRAVLRASAHGHVRILFPMISCCEEVDAALRTVDEAARELRKEGRPMADRIERGIMIEVPAAVTLADLLAQQVDFFSIGSNDLIQYTLAVDRGNEKLAYLYDPLHPAVLRALAHTVSAANRARIQVSSCGEMSGSPYGAAVLIGLGCTHLSMSPFQIREVKDLVRRVALVDLRRLAEEALRQATVEAVRSTLHASLGALLDRNGVDPTPGTRRTADDESGGNPEPE